MARGLSFVLKCFGSFTERKCYRHNKSKICQTTRASYTAIDSRRADKVRLWRGVILARCDFGAKSVIFTMFIVMLCIQVAYNSSVLFD